MRLKRLWVSEYQNLRDFSIEFSTPEWEADGTCVRVFAGQNGTGKSHTLEALGLIFSRLAINAPPALTYELEYTLNGLDVCITGRPETCSSRGLTPIEQVGVAVMVKRTSEPEWSPEHVLKEWPPVGLRVLPGRVIGYADGPTSDLDDVLTQSIERIVRNQWEETDPAERPEGLDDGEWVAFRKAQREEVYRRIEIYLDNPTTMFVGHDDAIVAATAFLVHDGFTENDRDHRRYAALRRGLLDRLGLRLTAPLACFSLEVRGDWEHRLSSHRSQSLRKILSMATLLVPIDSDPRDETDEPRAPDFIAVFDLTSAMSQALRGTVPSPYLLFEDLLAWKRRGAVRTIHLMPKKQGISDLLSEETLSDGEYLFLARHGLLLMLRQVPDALILLDEPETHFNDRWKADLVKDIRQLLDRPLSDGEGPSEVVLATHSAIVLSDLDDSQIFLFKRSGDKVAVAHPRVPTFAADISILTREVSERDHAVGSYASHEVLGRLNHIPEDPEKRRRLAAELESVLDRMGPGPLRLRLMDAIRRLSE